MHEQGPAPRFTPDGLYVTVDELHYYFRPEHAPKDRPHLFNYHITIHNHSDRTVTILARKWVLHYAGGEVDVFEGDKVVGRHSVTGTQQGEYMGCPPTGKPVTYDEIFIFRFVDGRIAETWGVVDVFAQMRQLGVIAA